jgi:FkbM family methyltransferase
MSRIPANAMALNRKRFLESASWTTGGFALGFLGRRVIEPAEAPAYLAPARIFQPQVASRPRKPAGESPDDYALQSFAQAGEDLAVRFFCAHRGITSFTYLDVGANDPVRQNNTYFFYRERFRGVLVEPNPDYAESLRSVRPEDKTLVAGIGTSSAREAEFYVMNKPALSTFSRDQAERMIQSLGGKVRIHKVITVPLLDINDVMAENFKEAPTFLSIDTEGMDLAILKTVDFARFRPKIVCAETLEAGSSKTIAEIGRYMEGHGYEPRGGSLVNTIFVDSKIL